MFAASLGFFLYSYSSVRPPPLATRRAGSGRDRRPLFTVFALHHSLFARPVVKRGCSGRTRVSPGPDPPRAAGLRLGRQRALHRGLCRWRPVPGELYQRDRRAGARAYAVHAAGIVLTARGSAPRRSRPRRRARGLAACGPSHVPLQTQGVYGFVRHPVYFAWVLMVVGTPHMTMTRAHLRRHQHALPRNCHTVRGTRPGRTSARSTGHIRKVRWRMIPGSVDPAGLPTSVSSRRGRSFNFRTVSAFRRPV